MFRQLGTHPNVVQFFGVHITRRNDIYIVMEYIDGGNLLDLLKDHGASLTFSDQLNM
jgi:serine/threonine protein kinase